MGGSRSIVGLGAGAAILSYVQLALELALSTPGLVPAGVARSVWIAITVTDGAKMLVIAALMIAVLVRSGRSRPFLGVFVPLTLASFVTIVLSGVGYLLLMPDLMRVAFLSLPLFLAWVVAAAAIAGSRRG